MTLDCYQGKGQRITGKINIHETLNCLFMQCKVRDSKNDQTALKRLLACAMHEI